MSFNENQVYFERPGDAKRDVIPHSTPFFDQSDIDAVSDTIKSGIIAPNAKSAEFEGALSGYLGVEDCFVSNSGTSALHLALLALGLNKGAKVLMPSLVCYAVLDAVNHAGAEPVFVDADPATLNICVKDAKRKSSCKPGAIIVPHLYGRAADIEEILNIGVPVIEDCSQALGCEVGGKKLGSFGAVSTFSFYATKLIATGTGGAVASNSSSLMERVKELGTNYYKDNYVERYNYRMSDLQASLGISQFAKLETFLRRRGRIAEAYNEAFKALDVQLPEIKTDGSHIYYRYMINVGLKRDEYVRLMRERGVTCETPDFPIHRFAGLPIDEYPGAETAYGSNISIPIYPYLTDIEVGYIADSFIATCQYISN